MNYQLEYDHIKTMELLLKEHLNKLQIEFELNDNQLQIDGIVSDEKRIQLESILAKFKICIIDCEDLTIVQQIKNAIDLLLNSENDARVNLSDYLSQKLNYSYSHLSKTFSETTFASIEQYVILKKIEKIKEFLIHSNVTLTEISYRLNYSSVAHLSAQFKKVTGLSPTSFVRIMESKKKFFSNVTQ